MELELTKKLDTFAVKTELFFNNNGAKVTIPCWVQYRTIKDVKIQKYYFINLLDQKMIDLVEKSMFDDFSATQEELFGGEFLCIDANLRKNMHLVFITKGEVPYEMKKVEKDFQYIRKSFIKDKDFLDCLNTFDCAELSDYFCSFNFQEYTYYLNRFNYIHGNNGSGKTTMMREMAKQFNVPLYDPTIFDRKTFDSLRQKINSMDKQVLELYYKRLWGFSSYKGIDLDRLSTFSNSELVMLSIATSLVIQEQSKSLLLVDSIPWMTFDDIRKLNLLETLNSSSTPVVITGFNEATRKLIKSKVVNANIIELT